TTADTKAALNLGHGRRARKRDGPCPCLSGLRDRYRVPVDVLIQSSGVGTCIRPVRAIGLQGTTLVDVEAILHFLARVRPRNHVAVVRPREVAEQGPIRALAELDQVVSPENGAFP